MKGNSPYTAKGKRVIHGEAPHKKVRKVSGTQNSTSLISGTQNSTLMTKLLPHKRENLYSKTTIPGSLQYEFHTPPHFQLVRLNFLLNILSGDTPNYSETKSTKLNQASPTYSATSEIISTGKSFSILSTHSFFLIFFFMNEPF